MEALKKLLILLSFVLILSCGWIVWLWGFCRFYVPSDQMAVISAKVGKHLEPGQILANKGQKGILENVLGEGRHFLNPFFYEWKIMPLVSVPVGKVGILTAKVGKDLSRGKFLADQGEKGIRRNVLGPGKYRFNPEGYKIDLVDAVVIDIGFVGVVTSLEGDAPKKGAFSGKDQKGVRKNILQPGFYYINPKQYKIDVVEIGINQISLLGEKGFEDPVELRKARRERDQPMAAGRMAKEKNSIVPSKNIEFPSKDGFEIHVDTTIEFELLPPNISTIFSHYGNLQSVIDKIILPQILSVGRLKGSGYGAKEFIVGEGREKFQSEFAQELEQTLKAKNIEILSALIRHVKVPIQILKPIQDGSIAKEKDLTNKEKQLTEKKLAELNTELALIDQKKEQIQQGTIKIKAEIKAIQSKDVANIQAETNRKVSVIEKETALVKADTERILGKATAEALQLVGEAKAQGLGLYVQAFKDPQAYSYFNLTTRLPDQMKIGILHAGEGTLWTDIENASAEKLGAFKWLGTSLFKEPQEK